MAGFGKSDVHIDAALSEFALAYVQDLTKYVADKALPPLKSKKESDKYFTFDRGNLRETDDLRAAGTQANRAIRAVLSNDSFSIEEHALYDIVSKREQDNADSPLEPKKDAVVGLTEQLMTNKELAAARTIFTTTAVANSVSLTAAGKWDATTTTTPITDVDTGRFAIGQEIGEMGNTGVTGADVWKQVKNHSDIIDRVKYTQRGQLSQELVASLMDLDNLYVGETIQLTTEVGITSEAAAFIWGKNFLISYVSRQPGRKSCTHAYGFTTTDGSMKVMDHFDQKYNGNYIEVQTFYDFKIVSSLCGYLIVDAVT
jgi:hypothetical protein